jgi:hypothetical protein
MSFFMGVVVHPIIGAICHPGRLRRTSFRGLDNFITASTADSIGCGVAVQCCCHSASSTGRLLRVRSAVLPGGVCFLNSPACKRYLSYSTSRKSAPFDAEILVSLETKHHPTESQIEAFREKLPELIPGTRFFPAGRHCDPNSQFRLADTYCRAISARPSKFSRMHRGPEVSPASAPVPPQFEGRYELEYWQNGCDCLNQLVNGFSMILSLVSWKATDGASQVGKVREEGRDSASRARLTKSGHQLERTLEPLAHLQMREAVPLLAHGRMLRSVEISGLRRVYQNDRFPHTYAASVRCV